MKELSIDIILNSIPHNIAIIKPDGTIIKGNNSFLKLLNKSEDSVIGNKCYRVIHNLDNFPEECPLIKAYKTGETHTYHINLGDRVFSVFVTPVKNEDSNISYLIYSLKDITLLKKTTAELQEYKEIYQTIVENAGEGIVIAQDEKILFVNSKMLEISGYSLEEALSRHFIEFIHPECRQEVMELYRKMQNGEEGVPEQYQLKIIHKNGDPIWIDTNTVPIILNGKIATLNFIRDITRIKKAEEEKAQLKALLIQSQKMEAVGRFVAGIIHDFNNILTPIKGFAQLSMDKTSEHEILRKYLETIIFSSERAEKLIKQLMSFSKKQSMELKILNLNSLIENIEDMLKRLLGEDILLIKNLSPDLSAIEADPSQMVQVIVNLAANARDAMPLGGQFIIETSNVIIDDEYLKKFNTLKAGPYVMISFTDTGIGINPEVLDQIFTPFFTTKEQSTGLGLSTVYGIVRQHKGNILVQSEPGKGTTFKVYLPAVDKEIDRKQIEKVQTKIIKGTGTVMVIDDDENVRQTVIEMLKKLGYKPLDANTPDMAIFLAQFYNQPIDLVISDIVLPGINGLKLFNRIKLHRPNIKVLYMSAYPDEVLENYGIDKEKFNFIQKPFSIEDLSIKIREVLKNNR